MEFYTSTEGKERCENNSLLLLPEIGICVESVTSPDVYISEQTAFLLGGN